MRAALYLRVSKEKKKQADGTLKGQTTENQLPSLEKLAAFRGFEVVRVVREVESGAKQRPELAALLASDGYDVLLIWALDRLGRGGALEALSIIDALDKRGIAVVSVQESWLDTSRDNPLRDVLISFSATIAKMERARIIARTRAGLAHAKANGVQLGKPSKFLIPNWREVTLAWKTRTGGIGLRGLASDLGGVSVSTAARLADEIGARQ